MCSGASLVFCAGTTVADGAPIAIQASVSSFVHSSLYVQERRVARLRHPLCLRHQVSSFWWCFYVVSLFLCRHYSSRRCAHCPAISRIQFCSFFFVCAGKKRGAPPPPPPFPANGTTFVLLCLVIEFRFCFSAQVLQLKKVNLL